MTDESAAKAPAAAQPPPSTATAKESTKPAGVDRTREALDKAAIEVAAKMIKELRPDGSLDPAAVADAALDAVAPGQRAALAGAVSRAVEASAYRDDPSVAARVAVEAVSRLAK